MALDAMIAAAALAGLEIKQAFNTSRKEFEVKSNSCDLVTATDVKCQELIVQYLLKHFPDHVIIGEETEDGTGPISLSPDKDTFIIDPVDGTSNFFRAVPHCAVLITHATRGVGVDASVVLDPFRNELFYAELGKGAYFCHLDATTLLPPPPSTLQHTRMQVNSSVTRMEEAYVDSDLGYQREERHVAHFQRVQFALLCQHRVRAFRLLGSCGLGLAWVACGRTDVYVQWNGPYIWDFAGGALLVREAGGVAMSAVGGDELDLEGRSVLAACNSVIAHVVREEVRKSE